MAMMDAYPNFDQIQGQRQAATQQMAGQGGQAPNPVMDALKTLQVFVTAQRDQGNELPAQAFVGFLEAIAPGGGMEQPMANQMGPQAGMNGIQRPNPMQMNQGSAENMGRGMNNKQATVMSL